MAAGTTAPRRYDSAERREAFARSLEGSANEQEIRGRVPADTGNAKHPREAVTTPTGRSTKPRKSRAGIAQQRDHGVLARCYRSSRDRRAAARSALATAATRGKLSRVDDVRVVSSCSSAVSAT